MLTQNEAQSLSIKLGIFTQAGRNGWKYPFYQKMYLGNTREGNDTPYLLHLRGITLVSWKQVKMDEVIQTLSSIKLIKLNFEL